MAATAAKQLRSIAIAGLALAAVAACAKPTGEQAIASLSSAEKAAFLNGVSIDHLVAACGKKFPAMSGQLADQHAKWRTQHPQYGEAMRKLEGLTAQQLATFRETAVNLGEFAFRQEVEADGFEAACRKVVADTYSVEG